MTSAREVSVVIACNGPPDGVERCLDAVSPQLGGAEVVVCSPAPPSDELRHRHAEVSWHVREGALVPVLWRDGIVQTSGALVALTISPMVPRGDWLAAMRAALDDADAVGGAIEPGPGLRGADLAECFCRYARHMLPFRAEASLDLPGDNAGYRREALAAVAESWRDGFWEPDVHRELARRGATLRLDPSVVVEMGRSAGPRAFLRQRLVHGRVYGRTRGARFGVARNLTGIVAAPVVPFLLLARSVREARRRGRGRALARVLPLIVAYDLAWAAGEARGHLDAVRR